MERYEERNGQTYKIGVKYSLGGYSYLSHEFHERGYYLHVQPVSVQFDSDGKVVSESYTIFSGYKLLLQPVKRQNKKAFEQSIVEAELHVEKLIDQCEKERQGKSKSYGS